MDEEDIESFTNISQDSDKWLFHKLTNSENVDSSYGLHDAPKEKENRTDLEEFFVSDDNSNGSLKNDSATDKEAEMKELENGQADKETLLQNTDLTSKNNNEENGITIDTEIVLTAESAASKSMNDILTTKDSGIELDENKTVFNQSIVNSLIEAASNLEEAMDEKDVGISPDNIKVEPSCNVKPNFNAEIDIIHPTASDNDTEETIFNCQDRIEDTNQTIASDESVDVEVRNSNPSDHLVRSKSVAELSTTCGVKSNSLAEDAKLVKFSVSTKSVNIMQSNAQFLNKSRNFLNFITEKSTNIMEKTLLPQNLAAKYNSILKLTENNPTNYKKFDEQTPASSHSIGNNPGGDSELNYEANIQIPFNVMKLHTQDIESTNLCSKEEYGEACANNYGVNEDSHKEHQNLFLKCSVIENKFDDTLRPNKQETEIVSSGNTPESILPDSNMMEDEKVHSSDFGVIERNRELELRCNDSETSNTESTNETNMNQNVSVKRNATDVVASRSDFESERRSVVHLKQDQEHDDQDSSKSLREESIDLELLAHPAYVTLLRDYSNLKDQSVKLSEAMVKVEMEKQRLEAENNRELHALQLEGLEKTIEQLKHDLKQSNANQQLLNKEYNLANKERESMVMKYAISEKQLIDTQRAREYAERKVNEALKEQELLHTKLKQVHGERTRICNILDSKCHELTDAQKEVERLKEELNMREVKLKWTQNKLKTELEAFKENQQKLDKAMLRINEMKEECEQVRKESHETIRKFQQSEENKVVTLDHQLKEQQARLILERHVTEDKEMSRIQLQKEVETLKQRQHALIEENNTLSLKVQNLEKERLNYENNVSNLKIIADQRQKEILDLVGKVSQLETLKLQLKHKEQLLSSNESEVERLRQSNAELQSDMEWCREREAHMLDFTEKLTDKNVRLQSEFTSIEAKNEQLELEQGPLQDQIKELTSKVKSLEISLASEKSKRTEECELLARHVAEQTQLSRNLSQKLEDSQGENAVLRRKQQISVKEMTKELQQCKKRLDAFETGSPSNSLDRTSRTGSSSSLSTGETLNGAVSDNSNSGDNILQSVEPDRQTLIDRIVKLQRTRVRQAEKLDFLEEHTRTLVNELQKKTKIIKNYILHENPDAMGSNERDRNKAELARHGGIMASVYNQRVSDDNMTLELSLEMNQKLQAVLEDTLLKNITLKDSIDTLGGEIARLTMQNKRRQ